MIFGMFGGEKKRVLAMIAAARTGDTEKEKQFLFKGANINAQEPELGNTPILSVAEKKQWVIAEPLRTKMNLQSATTASFKISRGV